MNNLKSSPDKYIFFLKLNKDLSKDYFILAKMFSQMDMNLIPVGPEVLSKLSEGSRKYVLVLVTDLQLAAKFKNLRTEILDFAVMANKYCLFDINSFGKINISHKFSTNNYQHFQLPMSYREILVGIIKHLQGDKRQLDVWPGGTRTTLPPV